MGCGVENIGLATQGVGLAVGRAVPKLVTVDTLATRMLVHVQRRCSLADSPRQLMDRNDTGCANDKGVANERLVAPHLKANESRVTG